MAYRMNFALSVKGICNSIGSSSSLAGFLGGMKIRLRCLVLPLEVLNRLCKAALTSSAYQSCGLFANPLHVLEHPSALRERAFDVREAGNNVNGACLTIQDILLDQIIIWAPNVRAHVSANTSLSSRM